MVLIFTLALFLFTGCTGTRVASVELPAVEGNTPWTQQDFYAEPDEFQFAVVSDRHGGGRPGIYPEAVKKLNLLKPEFVLCVGDLIDGYTEDRNVLDLQYGEMDDILSKLEMRFFRVVGNHDITNPVMLEEYKDRYGLPYYHFIYKDVLFLVVSTEDVEDESRISDSQVVYMQQILSGNPDVRWTFVFMHNPVYVPVDGRLDEGWVGIEEALVDRPHTVIAGHWHNYGKRVKHGQSYIHLATTGGASRLRGVEVGEFDHIVWITMTNEGPRIANIMLDGIYNEDVRVIE